MAEKIIAEYGRPRYAAQAWNGPYSKWETFLTGDNSHTVKVKAEAYAQKHDTRTRVIDREAEEE